MTTPRPEALAAGQWWASQLGAAEHDAGTSGPEDHAAAAIARFGSLPRAFTDEQRAAFAAEVAAAIETAIDDACWIPGDPDAHSSRRAIPVDYQPCLLLADAARRAGIQARTLDLPVKTRMRVDPGRVTVRHLIKGTEAVIWEASC